MEAASREEERGCTVHSVPPQQPAGTASSRLHSTFRSPQPAAYDRAHREARHAPCVAAAHNGAQGFHAGRIPSCCRAAPRRRPARVAIHDDCQVAGQQLNWDAQLTDRRRRRLRLWGALCLLCCRMWLRAALRRTTVRRLVGAGHAACCILAQCRCRRAAGPGAGAGGRRQRRRCQPLIGGSACCVPWSPVPTLMQQAVAGALATRAGCCRRAGHRPAASAHCLQGAQTLCGFRDAANSLRELALFNLLTWGREMARRGGAIGAPSHWIAPAPHSPIAGIGLGRPRTPQPPASRKLAPVSPPTAPLRQPTTPASSVN